MIESVLLQLALLTSHEVTATSVTAPAPFVEREAITVSFGGASFEQYDAVHVSTPWSHNPMILVVPLGFGAAWYEGTDDYFDSLPARLAYFGNDVWIVEQRRGTAETLPSFSCPSPFPLPPGAPAPDTDCSAFGLWTLNDVIEDIEYVRTELIDSTHRPTIGGQWTGGMAAQAVVNSDARDEYAGVMLWEGTMSTVEESTLAKNAAACAFLQTIPPFLGASSTPGDEFVASQLAQDFPDDPSPFPPEVLAQFGLAPGATNLHVLHAIFIADTYIPASPFPLDRVAEGLVFMVGTIEDGPDVADIEQVFNIANVEPHGTYASTRILQDYACGLGGDSEHTSNLDLFEGDVLVIGSDRGLRTELEDTMGEFASARFVSADFRGELGVHDLLWSDLREAIDLEIFLFNLFAQL